MNERHISGTVRAASVSGNALRHAPVSGTVRVTGNTIRELVFGPRSSFPETGQSGVLYIDTDNNMTYYWDAQYISLSAGIDDETATTSTTWSSHKISEEFQDCQDQLDRVANFEAMTNLDIQRILDS